jgi:hypothetical protein
MFERRTQAVRKKTRFRRARLLLVEPLEERALLAALQFTAGLGEQSTLDSVVQNANYLPDVNTPNSQTFDHTDGTAVSNVTLTTGPSTAGSGGVNIDILSNGSVAKKGFANTSVVAGLADSSGTIGSAIPVTIVPTDPSEKIGDPVTLEFDFTFDVELFASNTATGTFNYSVSYTYMGTPTTLVSNTDILGGGGITPSGPGPMDHTTGTLNAHIGDSFTLTFSEQLAGDTMPPFGPLFLNNVGWLIDTSLDAGITRQPPILSDVSFGGPGFSQLVSDPTPSGSVTTYVAPQWGGPNNNQYPVLYSGGSTPTVSADFQLPNSQPIPSVEARGNGPDGFNVPATNLTQNGDTLTLPDTPMNQAFGSVIQYYKDFTINWQTSYDGGNTWVDVGTSDNPMYVTAAAPIPDPTSGQLFLTVVNSAVMNTQGLSSGDNAQIISQTWGIFTGLSVTDYAGTPLSYYASMSSQNTTVASLLQFDDGQCGAWTGLFLDMLLVNGINPAGDYVVVKAGTPGEAGFLVNNWNFPSSGTGNPLYPYVNYNVSSPYPVINNNQYVWTHAEVTRAAGIPGQNSANPASLFNNHQIAEINGIYYDPSYGVTYNSLLQMDSQSIAGFFATGQYYAAPLHKFVTAMFIRQNTNPKSGDLSGTAYNWANQSDPGPGITTIQSPVALEANLATNPIPLDSISRAESVIALPAISDWGPSTVRNLSTTVKRTVTPVRQPVLGTAPSRAAGSIRVAQKTKPLLYGEA